MLRTYFGVWYLCEKIQDPVIIADFMMFFITLNYWCWSISVFVSVLKGYSVWLLTVDAYVGGGKGWLAGCRVAVVREAIRVSSTITLT